MLARITFIRVVRRNRRLLVADHGKCAVRKQKTRGQLQDFFDLKDANVSKEALAIIDVAAADFKSKAASLIEVEGNTDTSADEAANKKLARNSRRCGPRCAQCQRRTGRRHLSDCCGIDAAFGSNAQGTKEPLN